MITIDGISYDLPLTSINRKVDPLFKFAERTEDAVLHSEILAMFYNYDVGVGMSANNVADYAALFLKLSEPVETHTIIMPGAPAGYGTFECYFAGVKDEISKYQHNGVDYFRNLSFSIIATSPSRIPA